MSEPRRLKINWTIKSEPDIIEPNTIDIRPVIEDMLINDQDKPEEFINNANNQQP